MEWWNTNFLENYLIKHGVTAQTKFAKIKAVFSDNNTKMTVSNYYTGDYETAWDTLTEAKAASTILVDPDSPDITLTR